jgi:hypothetical protein
MLALGNDMIRKFEDGSINFPPTHRNDILWHLVDKRACEIELRAAAAVVDQMRPDIESMLDSMMKQIAEQVRCDFMALIHQAIGRVQPHAVRRCTTLNRVDAHLPPTHRSRPSRTT